MKIKKLLTSKEAVVALSISTFLFACAKSPQDDKLGSNSKNNAGGNLASNNSVDTNNAQSTSGGSSDQTNTSPNISQASDSNGKTDTTNSTNSTSSVSNSGDNSSSSTNSSGAQLQPGSKINLAELPNDIPICTVAGNDIKVGDFKRMLRLQQLQANQAIVLNPAIRAKLLEEAKKNNISLSEEEKTKLLAAARQQKGKNAAEFAEFLKKNKATEKQFDDDLLSTGLAFKTSNLLIEKELLPQLVRRELLAQAAQEEGLDKKAMSGYQSFKASRRYDEMQKQTGLTPDDMKEEFIKAELARMEIEKLQKTVKADQSVVKALYEANKSQFKHDERIRISTLLIACPERDLANIKSVRSQVQAANPKLAGAELDKAVEQVKEQAKQKALIILGRAKAGEDFAKLANENSDDAQVRASKNGGDLGLVEKKVLVPQLADQIWKLKPGQIFDQLVKSDVGYNIYKVTGKEAAGTVKFEDLKPLLEAQAKMNQSETALNKWINERQKKVKVQFTPKFLALSGVNAGETKKIQ